MLGSPRRARIIEYITLKVTALRPIRTKFCTPTPNAVDAVGVVATW